MKTVDFFKQKTAYELRISDWSSDFCSSDLRAPIAWPNTISCFASKKNWLKWPPTLAATRSITYANRQPGSSRAVFRPIHATSFYYPVIAHRHYPISFMVG